MAPDFALPALDGSTVRLSDLRGSAVLLNFWATWCAPCREEMPAMQALHEARRDDGLVVLAVNWGEGADAARAFVQRLDLTYPVVLDEDQGVGRRYLTYALPVSYWIGRDGVIVDRVAGAMSREAMHTKAERVLAPGADAPAEPRSVREAAASGGPGQVLATLDGTPLVRAEDVDRRVDVLLALERLATGAVLDPLRAADRTELAERRRHALRALVDEVLLVDAATAQGLTIPDAEVEAEVERVAGTAGGVDGLARELGRHGVTPDELRVVFRRGALARRHAEERVLSAETVGPPDQAIRAWLDAERARRRVEVLDEAR